MVPGAESFIERRHRDGMKLHGTDSVSPVLARSHSLPLPLPPLHSAKAGDWVDGVTVGRRALEGREGGDVTVVGRLRTATARLPCGTGHKGRRGGAVPHVG